MYSLNIPTEHDGIITKPWGSWASVSCISVLGVKKSESMDCHKTIVIRTFGSLQHSVLQSSQICFYILNHVDRKAEAILAIKDKMLKRFEMFFSEVIFGFLGLFVRVSF